MTRTRRRAIAHFVVVLALVATFVGSSDSGAAEAPFPAPPPKPVADNPDHIVAEQPALAVTPSIDPREEHGFAEDAPSAASIAAVRDAAENSGRVRVIVGLKSDWAPEGLLSEIGEVASQRVEIAGLQDALLATAPGAGVLRRYETIPFIGLSVESSELDILLASGLVASLQIDVPAAPTLRESIPIVGSDVLDAESIDGRGTTIAILDTGIEKAHPFMAGGVIRERCFADDDNNHATSSGDCPNGLNYQETVGAGEPCTWGQCDHGTHVAGIAAGLNGDDGETPLLQGVANGAWFASYQVFHESTCFDSDNNPYSCARTWPIDYVAALEDLFVNEGFFAAEGKPLAAVNMSLGDGEFTSHCDASFPATKSAIDNLRSVGIATVIAAGNDAYAEAIGSPACISTAISVGNTTDADKVLGWTDADGNHGSNVASFMDVFAPGSEILSSVPGGWATKWGTSMAAPHVAGAIAILKQVDPGASVDDMVAWLEQSGHWVLDDRSWAPGDVRRPRIWLDPCLSINPECFDPPPNNHFASAYNLKLVDCDGANPCYSYLATTQPNEPSHAGSAGGHSVWFKWKAPVDGTITVDTAGSDFDTLLAVYTGGSLAGLKLEDSNDDEDFNAGILTSRVTDVPVNKGKWYSIAVDGYTPVATSLGPAGRVHIDLSFTPAPHLCNGHAATIVGTGAADTLTGTSKRDVIVGYGGGDTIEGKGGNDVLCGGAGNDIIDGGIGGDVILGGSGGDVINGGKGHDEIEGRDGRDVLRGNDGIDVIEGGPKADDIFGGTGGDTLQGGTGPDEIWGGAGFDDLLGNAGNDVIIGGGKGDEILGGNGADEIHGKAGNDILKGNNGKDILWGEIGHDTLHGQKKIDALFGGPGNDLLHGGPADDSCVGGTGSDTLISC